MKKFWKYIILFLIVVLGITFFVHKSSGAKKCEEAFVELKLLSIQGLVHDKFVDQANHMNKLLVILDEMNKLDTIWFTADKSGLFEFLNKNDSISKTSGTYMVKVVRNDYSKEFLMDYNCE